MHWAKPFAPPGVYNNRMNRFAFACLVPLLAVRPAFCAPPVTAPAPAASPAAPIPDKQPPETPDYPGAVWEPASPHNFQKASRPSADRPLQIIVIHDIEGAAMSAVRWFQNPQAEVSAHYVVDADTGTVYQQVKERDVAWHAGNRDINGRGIGIEQTGFAYRPGFFTPKLYETTAQLVRDITKRNNIPRDRTHIIGHFEVPDPSDPTKFGGRGGHTDPGPYFDWDYFMTLVRNDSQKLVSPPMEEVVPGFNAPLVLHPGETFPWGVTFTNTGDDSWQSDHKDAQEIERRKAGIVYLGAVGDTDSPLYNPAWLSPRYVSSLSGDALPGAMESFTVPVRAPINRLGSITQVFRLVSVSPAPHRPVPFGASVSLSLNIVPWDLTFQPPVAAPAGWNAKPAPGGSPLCWSKSNAANVPLKWEADLPVAGEYEVYVRFVPDKNRTAGAAYHVGGKTLFLSQRGGTAGEWRKLGRFAFTDPVPVAAPALGAKPTFDAVAKAATPQSGAVRATVELSGSSPKPGIIAAGAVRFVGPFPKP